MAESETREPDTLVSELLDDLELVVSVKEPNDAYTAMGLFVEELRLSLQCALGDDQIDWDSAPMALAKRIGQTAISGHFDYFRTVFRKRNIADHAGLLARPMTRDQVQRDLDSMREDAEVLLHMCLLAGVLPRFLQRLRETQRTSMALAAAHSLSVILERDSDAAARAKEAAWYRSGRQKPPPPELTLRRALERASRHAAGRDFFLELARDFASHSATLAPALEDWAHSRQLFDRPESRSLLPMVEADLDFPDASRVWVRALRCIEPSAPRLPDLLEERGIVLPLSLPRHQLGRFLTGCTAPLSLALSHIMSPPKYPGAFVLSLRVSLDKWSEDLDRSPGQELPLFRYFRALVMRPERHGEARSAADLHVDDPTKGGNARAWEGGATAAEILEAAATDCDYMFFSSDSWITPQVEDAPVLPNAFRFSPFAVVAHEPGLKDLLAHLFGDRPRRSFEQVLDAVSAQRRGSARRITMLWDDPAYAASDLSPLQRANEAQDV